MTDRRVSAGKKRQVEERAAGNCEYCRSQVAYSVQSFAVEHIDSTEDEGGETLENLAFACQGCNNHKYAKTQAPDPNTGEVVPLFHPRRQRWSEHFAWSEDHTIAIGLTPTGRDSGGIANESGGGSEPAPTSFRCWQASAIGCFLPH